MMLYEQASRKDRIVDDAESRLGGARLENSVAGSSIECESWARCVSLRWELQAGRFWRMRVWMPDTRWGDVALVAAGQLPTSCPQAATALSYHRKGCTNAGR